MPAMTKPEYDQHLESYLLFSVRLILFGNEVALKYSNDHWAHVYVNTFIENDNLRIILKDDDGNHNEVIVPMSYLYTHDWMALYDDNEEELRLARLAERERYHNERGLIAKAARYETFLELYGEFGEGEFVPDDSPVHSEPKPGSDKWKERIAADE